MEWASQDHGTAMVVTPGAGINHDNADDFDALLMPAVIAAGVAGKALVVDLAKVDYMSSVGLRVLMRAAKEARGASVTVSIANLNDTMREIFQISRFDKIFTIHDSVEAALT